MYVFIKCMFIIYTEMAQYSDNHRGQKKNFIRNKSFVYGPVFGNILYVFSWMTFSYKVKPPFLGVYRQLKLLVVSDSRAKRENVFRQVTLYLKVKLSIRERKSHFFEDVSSVRSQIA